MGFRLSMVGIKLNQHPLFTTTKALNPGSFPLNTHTHTHNKKTGDVDAPDSIKKPGSGVVHSLAFQANSFRMLLEDMGAVFHSQN